MGSGKSAVGRSLAGTLGVTFVDLDMRIERMFGVTVEQAFGRGEGAFRDLEAEALRSLLAEPAFGARRSIVATGGGTVVDADNRARIDACGPRVLLRAEPETLAARLVGAQAQRRPLVAAAADPTQRLRALWRSRREAYESGAVVVSAEGSVDQVAGRVLEALDLRP